MFLYLVDVQRQGVIHGLRWKNLFYQNTTATASTKSVAEKVLLAILEVQKVCSKLSALYETHQIDTHHCKLRTKLREQNDITIPNLIWNLQSTLKDVPLVNSRILNRHQKKTKQEAALVITCIYNSKQRKQLDKIFLCFVQSGKLPNHHLHTKFLASMACQVPSREAYGKLTSNHS